MTKESFMDASFFYTSGYMNQQVDRVHYCPFIIALNQEFSHYDPARNPIVSKMEGESTLTGSCTSVQLFLYLYFCRLISFQHLERQPNYMEEDLSDLITSPADKSCLCRSLPSTIPELHSC